VLQLLSAAIAITGSKNRDFIVMVLKVLQTETLLLRSGFKCTTKRQQAKAIYCSQIVKV
jgi:hypothetical protein